MKLIPDFIRKLIIPNETFAIDHIFSYYIPKNTLMVDVGACHGDSCLDFLNKGWTVHAFEPNALNRKELQKNTNKLKIIINKEAVSNVIERGIPFFSSNNNNGIGSLMKFSENHNEQNLIDVTTSDKYVEDNNISHIDYLKIDAEGYDKFVLDGLNFKTLCPQLIMCEYEDNKTLKLNYSKKDLIDGLLSNGYNIVVSIWKPIVSYGGAHQWDRFEFSNFEKIPDKSWGNIIAIKEDQIFHDFLKCCNKISGLWSFNIYYYIRKILD